MSIAAPRPTPTIAAASWMWAAVSPTSMRAAPESAREPPRKVDSLVSPGRYEGAGCHCAGPFLLERAFSTALRRAWLALSGRVLPRSRIGRPARLRGDVQRHRREPAEIQVERRSRGGCAAIFALRARGELHE